MTLSIISLNFRKADLTILSMQSLYEQYKVQFENNQFEYIVVDNNSGDNTPDLLKKEMKKFKNFHFVQNPKNSGFGAGNNLGAKHAKGKYLLFLNNDTQVKDQSIAIMAEYLKEHHDISILGGALKNADGSSQSSVGTFFTPLYVFLLLIGMQRFGLLDKNPTKITKADWVKGALLMIKKDDFEKLGGFDEKIFMYTEDMELCYRAHKKGYKIYFYPTTGVYHKDQGSSNRTFAIVNIYENILYFFKKHKPSWQYHLVKFMLQTKAQVLILLGKLYNKEYLVKTYGQAIEVIR